MCRFLLIKSEKKRKMGKILHEFTDMAKESRTEDGDWQEDGWGVSWREKNKWKLFKSLSPIWEEKEKFDDIPETNLLVVHARSASFEKHKGKLDYNQPYIDDDFSFVFNGLLMGVKTERRVEGEIGAQKIWTLLKEELDDEEPSTALKKVHSFLKKSSKKINGLNIGLSDGKNIFALCGRHEVNGYFTLKRFVKDDFSMISSEEFGNYDFESLEEEEVIAL